MGPLARADFSDSLDVIVQNSIKQGAVLKLGGKKVEGSATQYEPTVLIDVKPEYDCFTTETFGPVFSVTKAATNEELIRLGNQTEYGLAASLFTQDPAKAAEFVPQI